MFHTGCLDASSEQKIGLNWRRLYHVSKVTYHTFIQPDLRDIQFPAPCQTFPLTKDMWEKCPELSHYRRRVDRFLPMSAFIKLEYMGSQRFFPIVPSWPLFPDRPITQPRPARVSALCSTNAKTCARQMQNLCSTNAKLVLDKCKNLCSANAKTVLDKCKSRFFWNNLTTKMSFFPLEPGQFSTITRICLCTKNDLLWQKYSWATSCAETVEKLSHGNVIAHYDRYMTSWALEQYHR